MLNGCLHHDNFWQVINDKITKHYKLTQPKHILYGIRTKYYHKIKLKWNFQKAYDVNFSQLTQHILYAHKKDKQKKSTHTHITSSVWNLWGCTFHAAQISLFVRWKMFGYVCYLENYRSIVKLFCMYFFFQFDFLM